MQWHPHFDVWALILLVSVGYVYALKRLAPGGERPATRGQIAAFALGVAAIWIAADWPVHELAEGHLYSIHMVQHMLLSLVAPPLLLLGTPGWLARRLLRPRAILRVARFFSRPLVALVLFNLVVALSHWPAVVDLTVRSEIAHLSAHIALFGSAMFMWMPVLSPLMEIPRLPYPGQMLYLFAHSILPTIPASFLTFGDSPMYPAYAEFPRILGISVMADQRVAGLIMKIGGGLLLWTVIAILFFRWHAQETREGTDALAWRDVERDLNRVRP